MRFAKSLSAVLALCAVLAAAPTAAAKIMKATLEVQLDGVGDDTVALGLAAHRFGLPDNPLYRYLTFELVYDTAGAGPATGLTTTPFGPDAIDLVPDPFISARLDVYKTHLRVAPVGSFDLDTHGGYVAITEHGYYFNVEDHDQITVPEVDEYGVAHDTLYRRDHGLFVWIPLFGIPSLDTQLDYPEDWYEGLIFLNLSAQRPDFSAVHYNIYGQGGGVSSLRIEDITPGSTAPEPAAWALMLLGFGAAGAALRRRRAAVAA